MKVLWPKNPALPKPRTAGIGTVFEFLDLITLRLFRSAEHESFSRQNYPSGYGKNVIFGSLEKK